MLKRLASSSQIVAIYYFYPIAIGFILRFPRRVEKGSLSFLKTKCPLVGVALLFSLGIVLQYRFQFTWNSTLLVLVAGSLSWMIISWQPLPSPWPIVPFMITAGAFWTAYQLIVIDLSSPSHLRHLIHGTPQYVALRGIVKTDPTERVVEEKKSSTQKDEDHESIMIRSEFEFQVTAIKINETWQPADGLILGRSVAAVADDRLQSTIPTTIEYSQQMEIEGILREPPVARNFGLFDYAAYLRRKGIHYLLETDSKNSIRILDSGHWSRWIFKTRKKLSERLTLGIEKDSLASGIIRGMLLGYREDIPNDVNEAFRRTGTLHVFAISGSHISLIAFTLLIGLNLLRVPRTWVCLVVLPVLIFYVIATGLRASSIRSLLMAAVVILGWSIQRPSVLLNSLAASAFIILIGDPLQLFDPGFQLSFIVVSALILLAPGMNQKICGWLEPDPYIPRSYLPRWRLALIPPCQWVASLIAVCLAAWIGSLGLTLYYFNLISVVAILANLLIIPLAAASVALGMVSLLLGMIWNQLAMTFNTTHAVLIHMMVYISEYLSGWKFGYGYLPSPSIGCVVAGYLCLIAIILLWIRKQKILASGLFLGCVGLLSLVGFLAWNSKDVRIDFLDVGNGQATLITGPHLERILVDAGNKTQGRLIVEPFLRSRGVNRIDLAIITHGDASHYGGFFELSEHLSVRRVAVADGSFRSKKYRQLLTHLKQAGISMEPWHLGNHQSMDSGEITTLWPPKNIIRKRADDLGLIFQFKTSYGSCLFASDAGETTEKWLQEHAESLPSCALLIQGAHSHEKSLTETYLQWLKPKIMILNTSRYPSIMDLSLESKTWTKKYGATIYSTDTSGGITALLKDHDLSIESCL